MKRYISPALTCFTLLLLSADLNAAPAALAEKDIPARLGWVALPPAENICCGYYNDASVDLGAKPLPPLMQTPVAIDAEGGTFHEYGNSLLFGNVTMAQPGRLVSADRVNLYRSEDGSTADTAALTGNVTLREPGKLVFGDNAQMELHSKVAAFLHAIYRMALSTNDTPRSENGTPTLTAWGKADALHQDKKGVIELTQASYTTCAPTANSWRVNAKKIQLNRDAGRGTAYGAWLDIKDVPVFYVPYFNFPIDSRRESGFLFPTFSTSTRSGFNFTVPYYWNIAPNYDALITPHIFTERGLQMNGNMRYLTEHSAGNLSLSYLPNDKVFTRFQDSAASKYSSNPALRRLLNASNDRSAFSWHDATIYNTHWSSAIDYNEVSDDYYPQDFKDIQSLADNQLSQRANLNYMGENWDFSGKLQGYQTLHPVNQIAVNNPYSTLPELNWNGFYSTGPVEYALNNQFSYYTRSPNPGEITPVPRAGRINIQPGISLPLSNAAGFFTPSLQLAMTHYDVYTQVPGYKANIQRNLPIFNIDSGLFFDRHTQLWGQALQQTLEPRLFYLWAPYRSQDNIPLFDTGILPFTYDSLFMNNRFSGIDRIGDANQLAYALTSRFFNAANVEKFRLSIGQIYYFKNRRVNLCTPGAAAGTTPSTASNYGNCNINPQLAVGATSATEKFSPITGQLAYNFNPYWSSLANVAWDASSKETVNAGATLQYKPAVNHIINLNYNYIRFGDAVAALPHQPHIAAQSHSNDLNQAGVSFAWPVREHVSAVGGYTYNFSHQYTQTYFYGLEYNSCCYALRLVAGHMFTGLNQNNNPTFNNVVYLQWQFKGLSNVGTNDPGAFLLNSVPGYQNNFQPF